MSGGEDKLVKLWGYDDGMNYYSGIGHSSAIVKVNFNEKRLHSVQIKKK